MFKETLIKNFQEGLYLLVKYGLIIIVIVYAYVFMMNTYQMANNGNSAAIAINDYIKNGYLPSFPLKPNTNNTNNK